MTSARLIPLALAGVLWTWAGPAGAQQGGEGEVAGAVEGPLPLSPTRQVEFQVTGGTRMSVDVSPDGRTIAFDLLGDLYTVSISGGRARRLTSGMAFNREPRYSPDGRRLAFISDRSGGPNLWIMDRDGRDARRLSDLQGDWSGTISSPEWSPDGKTIVVAQKLGATRPGGVSLVQLTAWPLATYDVETGRSRWVTDTASERIRSFVAPAFARGGRAVYAAVRPFEPRISYESDTHIARVDLETGTVRTGFRRLAGRAEMRPRESPDGRYLVYATTSGSRLGLRVRDLRTAAERWLVREVVDDPPLWAAGEQVPGYAFTPDSKAVIIAYGGHIRRVDLRTGLSAVVPLVVDVKRRLGPLGLSQFTLPDSAVRTRSVMQPALSPDGGWVAFSALDRIWIMRLPSGGGPPGRPHRLTADSVGEFYPSWSPDGRWIAYSTWKDDEGGAVRRARARFDAADSPAPSEQLTMDTALYLHTAVAPDGKRVVAVRAPLPASRVMTHLWPEDLALVWLPAGGGQPHEIGSLAGTNPLHDSASEVVDQVYFTSDSDRVYVGLTPRHWDGTPARTSLAVTGPENSYRRAVASGVLSPDGHRAVIVRGNILSEAELVGAGAPRGAWLDTVDVDPARPKPRGEAGAVHSWGFVLTPWISWSRDGGRVLFAQGGSLFWGDVRADGWTRFARVDVPLTVPPDIPVGAIVLRGARLITMRGARVIERGDLVVRNNRIAALGPAGRVAIPAGAKILDLTGMTILPGYVDVHDHMWLPEGVHPQQSWRLLVRLAHGVTTSRDPYSHTTDVFAYRERERSGDLLGPRVFSTGMAYADRPSIATIDDARQVVRTYAEFFGAETFKLESTSADRRTQQLLAIALREQGMNGTVHTSRFDHAVTVALDGFSGLEHQIPVETYPDVAALIGRSATTHTQTYGSGVNWSYMLRRYADLWSIPTMVRFVPPAVRPVACVFCSDEGSEELLELDDLRPLVRGAAQTVAQGGHVAMGSHGDIPGIGFHYEMWFHTLGGMPNHEILRSATLVGATAIGHAHDFGSLEPGKLADLQILDRNPLEDIHNTTSVRYVMKNGRLYQADDLTEIWPRHKPLPSIYLWDTKDSSSANGSNGGLPGNSVGPTSRTSTRERDDAVVETLRRISHDRQHRRIPKQPVKLRACRRYISGPLVEGHARPIAVHRGAVPETVDIRILIVPPARPQPCD